ncbi:DUF1189 domain-containing protein [Bacillus mesophilum]
MKMNIFKQFIKSLYSPKDISLFRFQGIGKTILYVFFLTFIAVIPTIYFLSTSIVNSVEEIKNSIENKFPDFYIEDGELHSDENKPITIPADDMTIQFDSTGTLTSADIRSDQNTVALLQDEFVFVAGGQVQTYDYSMLTGMTFSKQEVTEYLAAADSFLVIVLPIMAIFIYLFSAGLRFIEVSILALIGLLIKRMLNRNLQYRHTWRMSAYSVTLSTVFFTVMASLQTVVPNGAMISWLVGVIVLLLAIKEVPQPKKS